MQSLTEVCGENGAVMKNGSDKKINGEIEILRIIFASIVMLHHGALNFGFSFALNGGVSDEYFFVVTGCLMAKGVKGRLFDKRDIPNANWNHIIRKLKVFYPYYFLSFMLQIVLLFVRDGLAIKDVLIKIIYSLPQLLLLGMNGIYYNNTISVGGGWFVSAMIMAVFLLYPILLYNYELATKYIFPCIGIWGLGLLFINSGTIATVLPIVNNLFTSGLVRATAEISLGAFGYEVASALFMLHCSKLIEMVMTLLKWICFGITIIYTLSGFDNSLSPVIFAICLFGVIFSFSGKTTVIPCGKISRYLGRLSVSLYLTHYVVIYVFLAIFGNSISKRQFVCFIISSFLVAIVAKLIVSSFGNVIKKRTVDTKS